jgi:hypothetical protein
MRKGFSPGCVSTYNICTTDICFFIRFAQSNLFLWKIGLHSNESSSTTEFSHDFPVKFDKEHGGNSQIQCNCVNESNTTANKISFQFSVIDNYVYFFHCSSCT